MKIRLVFLLLILTILFSVPCFAAQTVSLSYNTVYTNLDFNGDGVADRFSYAKNHNDYGKLTINLNGTLSEVFVARGTAITYYKYSDTQIFLFVYVHQIGGGMMQTYRFAGNTIQPVNSEESELNVMERTNFHHVSGKYVYLADSPYHQSNIASFKKLMLKDYAITTFLFKYKYKPSAGKFVRASKYGKPEKTYTMTYRGKAFTTSSSPKKINKKGVRLKPGAKVKLVQVYIIPKKRTANGYTYTYNIYRFKIKYKGKYGWFTNSTNRPFA